MASSKTIQVVKNSEGGWALRIPANSGGQSSQAFLTRAEAVKAAQAVLRAKGGALQIHGPDGRIKSSFTLGRAAMTKLNAVEGLLLNPTVKSAFEEFDSRSLTPSQRRNALRKTITKSTSRGRTTAKG